MRRRLLAFIILSSLTFNDYLDANAVNQGTTYKTLSKYRYPILGIAFTAASIGLCYYACYKCMERTELARAHIPGHDTFLEQLSRLLLGYQAKKEVLKCPSA